MDCWNFHVRKLKALEKILMKNNYEIIRINGQRIYAPSPTSGILPPPKGTEIFIRNFPSNLYEDEIIHLFRKKGPIYNIRLMVDLFGRNRGFGFLSYFYIEDAYAAVEAFNQYKIRRNAQITVTMSIDNRKLFIGRVPKTMNLFEIQTYMRTFVQGISQVILHQEPYNEKLNRGFAFVEFESHRLAALARRELANGHFTLGKNVIYVDWALPLPKIDPQTMRSVTKLYLSNLPINLNSKNLKVILANFLPAKQLLRVCKLSTFAFVHFDKRWNAEKAYEKLLGLVIGQNPIGVQWARPAEYKKNYEYVMEQTENGCKNLPSDLRVGQAERDKKRRPKPRPSPSSSIEELTEAEEYEPSI